MPLPEYRLHTNRKLKESQLHGTPDFPCAGYTLYYTDREGDGIPWHWHEEIEILYIAEGQLRLKIPSAVYELQPGDCLILNSNILHYAEAMGTCSMHSLVFHAKLLTGEETSAFSRKYIKPLLTCPSFTGCCIPAARESDMTGSFCRAFCAMEQKGFGFEFQVREELSKIFLMLYKLFRQEINEKELAECQDNLRIRRMLEYIHGHYAEHISVAEIAKAADIGERECLRCFRKTIQLSPIQYLLKYRIIQGAEILLREPACSVLEAAFRCGFDSPSNFAKMFKRFYKCTPREYRKKKIY